MTLVVPAQSFLVDKQNSLLAGEIGRAEKWGASLAQVLGASTVVT